MELTALLLEETDELHLEYTLLMDNEEFKLEIKRLNGYQLNFMGLDVHLDEIAMEYGDLVLMLLVGLNTVRDSSLVGEVFHHPRGNIMAHERKKTIINSEQYDLFKVTGPKFTLYFDTDLVQLCFENKKAIVKNKFTFEQELHYLAMKEEFKAKMNPDKFLLLTEWLRNICLDKPRDVYSYTINYFI